MHTILTNAGVIQALYASIEIGAPSCREPSCVQKGEFLYEAEATVVLKGRLRC